MCVEVDICKIGVAPSQATVLALARSDDDFIAKTNAPGAHDELKARGAVGDGYAVRSSNIFGKACLEVAYFWARPLIYLPRLENSDDSGNFFFRKNRPAVVDRHGVFSLGLTIVTWQ